VLESKLEEALDSRSAWESIMSTRLSLDGGVRLARFVTCVLTIGISGAVAVLTAADRSNLAGKWSFNGNQSDKADEKIQKAQQEISMGRAPRGGGGYPGGGYPGGGYPGGGYPDGGYPSGGIGGPMGRAGGGGGMGRGGMGRNPGGMPGGGGLNGEDLERLARDPQTLAITPSDGKISIVDENGDERTLYPDGKKHKERDPNGGTTQYKTYWDGPRLATESKLKHSGKLTETYEVSPDGKRLYVTERVDNSGLAAPLVIRRVYDKR
jgi:hypothetical protein